MSETIADLSEQLSTYREQLALVDASVLADPDNADLIAAQAQLSDVIQLTEELLATAREQQAALVQAAQAAAASFAAATASTASTASTNAAAPVTASAAAAATVDVTAAAAAPPSQLAPGAACQAVWAGDGQLYNATVKRVLPSGQVVVVYEGYTDEVTLARDQISLAGDAAAAVAVASKKRKAAEDPYAEQPIPASLTILPSDSAQERERKKKRVKAIKSANRLKRLEKEKAQSANSWQKFINKKASSKAVSGFSTGKKTKKSLFASPDTVDGKVGVTNSGHGITESVDRKTFRLRHPDSNVAAAAAAADDDDDDDDDDDGESNSKE